MKTEFRKSRQKKLPSTSMKIQVLYFHLEKSKKVNKRSEQGLTLLETLVGILVISIVLAASTPPILFAAATRIQNSRAEQAMQLAQKEIDRVRLIVEREDSKNNDLPPSETSITDPENIKNVGAPTAICTSSCPVNHARQDGKFLIQVFREPGVKETDIRSPDPTPNTEDQVIAFRVGVRVYSHAAINTLTNGGFLETEAASLQMTSGLGQQSNRPLAVLYADFARGDLTLSLEGYKKFLNR
jgi:type II secretory pathway pseudopilin PulG